MTCIYTVWIFYKSVLNIAFDFSVYWLFIERRQFIIHSVPKTLDANISESCFYNRSVSQFFDSLIIVRQERFYHLLIHVKYNKCTKFQSKIFDKFFFNGYLLLFSIYLIININPISVWSIYVCNFIFIVKIY